MPEVRQEKLDGQTVTVAQKAGVDGRLFGSVTNADIAAAIGTLKHRSRESKCTSAERSSEKPALASTKWKWLCTLMPLLKLPLPSLQPSN